MIDIANLRDLADRLSRIDFSEVQRAALADAASTIRQTVRDALSRPPGDIHDAPWLRTGALRDSIDCENDSSGAVIGSNSDVAVDQELGTVRVPPRPFLVPAAAAAAGDVAGQIAAAIAKALAGAVQ